MAEGSKEEYSALAERFGEGWSGANAAMILEVFRDDAVFVPGPFDQPLAGKAAIEEYWRDISYEQAEIAFRFGEVFVAGPWFSTEFRCTFRRRRSGKKVDVRGALFCETSDGKISEMRMYWHRSTEHIGR